MKYFCGQLRRESDRRFAPVIVSAKTNKKALEMIRKIDNTVTGYDLRTYWSLVYSPPDSIKLKVAEEAVYFETTEMKRIYPA